MLPSEKGERAEIAVLASLAAAGKEIVLPFGTRRYDVAYEADGRLVKVQCKTGVVRKGAIQFPTASLNRHSVRRSYRNEVDLFGLYCHERCEVYVVPVVDVPLREASLRLDPPRNGQRSGIRWADKYLLSRDSRIVNAGVLEAPGPRIDIPLPGFDHESSVLTDVDIGHILSSTNVDIGDPMELPIACCAPLATRDLSVDEAEATARLFKALADPHRVRIVNRLVTATEPVCVCELNENLGISQPTVSFHLRKLLDAGIVEREQRGTWAYYSLNAEATETLAGVLKMEVAL